MPEDLQNIALTRVGNVQIAYETFGDPSDPPVLLVMGLSGQMIFWPDSFCEALVKHGLFVIRFDNRDVGLSTHFHDIPAPDAMAVLGGGVEPPYVLEDMAADAIGVLDALKIEAAHVVGASMGGMIAQLLAILYPDRVLSLTSIMSTTGNREVGAPTEAAIGALLSPPGTTREETIERAMAVRKVIGSPGFEHDEAAWEDRVGRSFDRSFDPPGVARQMAAVIAGVDRTEALGGVQVPALVIHGADDPLINVSGGKATAEALPNAELQVIDGMGHDFPESLVGRWADAIAALAKRG